MFVQLGSSFQKNRLRVFQNLVAKKNIRNERDSKWEKDGWENFTMSLKQ